MTAVSGGTGELAFHGQAAGLNFNLPMTGTAELLELLSPFVPDEFINHGWPSGATGGRRRAYPAALPWDAFCCWSACGAISAALPHPGTAAVPGCEWRGVRATVIGTGGETPPELAGEEACGTGAVSNCALAPGRRDMRT